MTWRAGSITVSVLPVNFAPTGQSAAGSPSVSPTTVSLVHCPPTGGPGVCNACRTVATAATAQPAGSHAGTVTFTGDTGCFWDVN